MEDNIANFNESDTIKLNKESKEKSRNILSEVYGDSVIDVDFKYIDSEEYKKKFIGLTGSEIVDEKICDYCRTILRDRTGTHFETLLLVDMDNGDVILTINSTKPSEISYSKENAAIIEQTLKEKKRILSIHNHPTGSPPSADDSVSAKIKGYVEGITCGHNASVYVFFPSEVEYSMDDCDEIHRIIVEKTEFEQDGKKIISIWKKTLRKNDTQ
ncbi:MAG: hypothetical protein II399_10445, partial [Lachnospiraceae bacterium]|nr:hypothetical protein [Lachnospiraceae bacterium]